MYNIYAPYLKNAQGVPTRQIKYDKSLKNLEKYYDYNNMYKKNVIHLKNKIVPNRKLSPLGMKKSIVNI